MPQLPNPEDLLGGAEDLPPLTLELECEGCTRKQKESFEWATYSPGGDPADPAWDGLLVSRMVKCKDCGAVDTYKLTALSTLQLGGAMLRSAFDTSRSRLAGDFGDVLGRGGDGLSDRSVVVLERALPNAATLGADDAHHAGRIVSGNLFELFGFRLGLTAEEAEHAAAFFARRLGEVQLTR